MDTASLYDHLADPAARLERFAVRRRHGISLTELRSVAWGLIESFEEIISLGDDPIKLDITVRQVPDEEAEADQADEEAVDAAFSARLNTLLETLRRCRALFTGDTSEQLKRALRHRDAALLSTYEDMLARSVQRLNEIEKTLVMFGAGTDEDDALVTDVIPVPADRSGSSLPFDL